MTVDKDALLAALRLRYDYFSAQSVLEIVRQRAGLDDKPAFDPGDMRAFRAALVAHGDRTDRVLARVDELLGGAPAEPAKPAAAESAKPVAAEPAKPVVEPAKGGKGGKSKQETEAAPAEAKATEVAPAKEAAVSAADAADAIETTISLKGLEVAAGEQVLICGGFPDLGDWDPEKARPLAREGELWLTTIKLAPETEVSFKFLRRDADGKVVWETGENRSVTAAEPLEATWR